MNNKIVGCQSVEDFNRFLMDIQKITLGKSAAIRYQSGIWPDVKVKVEDMSKGEIVAENISLGDTEFLMTMILMNIFMEEDEVRAFYEVLRKYFVKWNIPVLPFFTILDMISIDVKLTIFVALDLEKHKNETVDEWQAFAAQNESIKGRLRSDINRSGVFTEQAEAVNVYVQLLYMLAINPSLVMQASDTIEQSDILITRTHD